jgi:hypothetical protein
LARTLKAGEIYKSQEKGLLGILKKTPMLILPSKQRTIGYYAYQLPVWWGVLAAAKVGKGPSGISEHRQLVVLMEKGEERS